MFGIRKLVFVAALSLMPAFVAAPSGYARVEEGGANLVPGSFLRWPERGAEHAILVDKAQQRVLIYRKNELSAPVKVYTCSTGENEGRKARQNDRKTPEGVYFFTQAFDQKDLAPIYGTRAFPLDYPNPIDRREGRDGYGIWFHGLNKPLKPRDTNGCVAMENRDIDDLTSFIRLHDTPVVIAARAEMVDPARLKKDREEMEKIVEGWRKAWESKQIDKYMSYYSRRFTDGRKDWRAYKEHKTRLARQYEEIRVTLDNLAIYRNDGLAMATFYQSYKTAGFNSQGQKRLFFEQNSEEWKIVSEHFAEGPEPKPVPVVFARRSPPEDRPVVASRPAPQPEEKPAPPARKEERPAPPGKKPVSPHGEVRAFVETWRTAWERKDLRAYMACYDPSFTSRGMNIEEWKNHREGLNQQQESLSVELKQMKIVDKPGGMVLVTFVQEYRADSYRDVGLKQILIKKRGPHWKIKMEEWRPLRSRHRN